LRNCACCWSSRARAGTAWAAGWWWQSRAVGHLGVRRLTALAAAILALSAFNLTFRLGSEGLTEWDESLHGEIARRMREAETTRFTLVRYEAMGDEPNQAR